MPSNLASIALTLSLLLPALQAAPISSPNGIDSPSTSPLHGLWARSTISLPLERRVEQAEPSRVSSKGVTANCQWRWLSASTLDQAHCTVLDTACDSHEVYAYLQVGGKNGYKEVGKVRNDNGCRGSEVRDPKANVWKDGLGEIFRARVRACVDDNGIKDTCYSGGWVSNPLN